MYPNYNMYNQYYGFREYNYRNSEMKEESGEIITLNQAIDLIRKSVDDEKEDEMFYGILIEQAPTDKEKDIIINLYQTNEDELTYILETPNHGTGQILPADNLTNSSNNQMSYKENLEKALFGELDAIKKYRKIMGTMPSGKSYTLLMSIMTDEIRHANKYNFLIQMQK